MLSLFAANHGAVMPALQPALQLRGGMSLGGVDEKWISDGRQIEIEVELTGDGGDDGPTLVSVIPDQLRLAKASGKVGPA